MHALVILIYTLFSLFSIRALHIVFLSFEPLGMVYLCMLDRLTTLLALIPMKKANEHISEIRKTFTMQKKF